jgi:hypothetical protein
LAAFAAGGVEVGAGGEATGKGAEEATTGVKVIFTALSYLLSAPSAESTIDDMPHVKIRSAAKFAAIVAVVLEWSR